MSEFHVNEYFTDGEMWALLYALDVLCEQSTLIKEQWEFVKSVRNKLLNVAE